MVSLAREADRLVIVANRERIFALLILVATGLFFLDILTLPPPFSTRNAGPAFHPYLIVITIASCGAWLLYHSLGHQEEMILKYSLLVRLAAFAGLSMVYSIIIFIIGFFASSILYALAVILLFNYPTINLKSAVPISVVITLLVYTLFELVFNVRLPTVI